MNRVMKYHIANRLRSAVATLAIMLVCSLSATAQVPDAPNPPRLVNDFAGIFSASQAQTLEDSLVLFAKKTSNQIAIVTMTDLGGMAPAQMAYEIGEKWGVGTKEDRNGIVILIKPKTRTNGQAFIATGYGLEGAIPDAICKRIVSTRMIPHFKNNDYYGGVVEALNVLKPLASGEYSKEQFEEDEDNTLLFLFAIIIIISIIIIVANISGKNGGNRNNDSGTMGGGGMFFGPIIFGGGSGHSSGGFGGGGGFGGFGGGSFGGGGAGGSW